MEHVEFDADSVEDAGEMIRMKEQQMIPEVRVVKEKLRLIASVSSLMAGFSIVALVELQLQDQLPEGLIVAYSIVTCILITLHIFAVLLAVCVLPSLEVLQHIHSSDTVVVTSSPSPSRPRSLHQQRPATVASDILEPSNSGSPSMLPETYVDMDPDQDLQERLSLKQAHFALFKRVAEVAWMCSMGLGIMTFGVEVILVVWVKLHEVSKLAAVCATIVSAPLVLTFLVAAYFLNSRESQVLRSILRRKQKSLESKLFEPYGRKF